MGFIAEQTLVRTGALNQPVKTNPLPVGWYWIDVFDTEENNANVATFRDWAELNKNTVVIRRTEVHEPGMPSIWTAIPWAGILSLLLTDTPPSGIWALFEVTAPTEWDLQISLGWPNEATPEMTAADTIQRPPPEDVEWPWWGKWAVGGGVVFVGLVAIVALRR